MGYFRMTVDHYKREKWLVKVKATMLLTCCDERMKYHTERITFWKKEGDEAEKKLRESGITLTSHAVTGGTRTEARLDTSMANRVQECQVKQKDHTDSFNRFGAYRAMFKLMADQEIEMNADDVLYFNIEGADVGGDTGPSEDD